VPLVCRWCAGVLVCCYWCAGVLAAAAGVLAATMLLLCCGCCEILSLLVAKFCHFPTGCIELSTHRSGSGSTATAPRCSTH